MLSINNEKFKCFVRYIINAARHKRCVTYHELQNIFGLNRKQVGEYAGALGDFCLDNNYPLLNGLIVNTTTCTPSHGFNWYQKKYNRLWGEIISECWRKFHVKSTQFQKRKGFSELSPDLEAFLQEQDDE